MDTDSNKISSGSSKPLTINFPCDVSRDVDKGLCQLACLEVFSACHGHRPRASEENSTDRE